MDNITCVYVHNNMAMVLQIKVPIEVTRGGMCTFVEFFLFNHNKRVKVNLEAGLYLYLRIR